MTPLLLTYYYGSKNMKEQQYFVFFKPFSTAPVVEMTISSTVFCFSVIPNRKGIAEDIFITSSFISTQNVQKRCRHTCYDFALGRLSTLSTCNRTHKIVNSNDNLIIFRVAPPHVYRAQTEALSFHPSYFYFV